MMNDAVSIYFTDATLASAFVGRWCVSPTVESAGGVFCVRVLNIARHQFGDSVWNGA